MHQAHIDTIRSEPENPLCRSIYGDWLEEQADPRGEILRATAELTRPKLLEDHTDSRGIISSLPHLMNWDPELSTLGNLFPVLFPEPHGKHFRLIIALGTLEICEEFSRRAPDTHYSSVAAVACCLVPGKENALQYLSELRQTAESLKNAEGVLEQFAGNSIDDLQAGVEATLRCLEIALEESENPIHELGKTLEGYHATTPRILLAMVNLSLEIITPTELEEQILTDIGFEP